MIEQGLKNAILGINCILIILYISQKINPESRRLSKVDISAYCLLGVFIGLFFIKVLAYKIIFIVIMIILLNYYVLKISSINSFLTAILSYVIFMVGDVISGSILVIMFKYNIITIENNFTLSLIINQMTFLISFIIVYISSPLINKFKVNMIESPKRMKIIIISNLGILLMLITITSYIFEYAQKYMSQYVNEKMILISASLIIFFLLVLSILTIYLLNSFINQKIRHDEIKEISKVERMTGTLNRESGLEFLLQEMEKSKKMKLNLTVGYLDINHLKYINDNFGHREGDKVIKSISNIINDNLRESDIISRIGGDEFIVVFTNCNLEQAKTIWGRMENKLNELQNDNEFKYEVSVSIGFIEYSPEMEITMEDLIAAADKKMYEKKRKYKTAASLV